MRPVTFISRAVLLVAILFGLLPSGGCALIDRCLGKMGLKQTSPPAEAGTSQNGSSQNFESQKNDAVAPPIPITETAYKPEIGQAEYLQELSSEVARLHTELEAKEQTIQNLDASILRQASAVIPPNAPLQYNPVIRIEGVQVLPRDGETLRIAIDDAVLFHPNATAQLLPSADEVLGTVLKEIRVNYPNNTLGIEGHADPILDNPQNPIYAVELTYRKAAAVFQRLLDQKKVSIKQIKVTGHGIARPLPGGRPEKNNRIEIVVFP